MSTQTVTFREVQLAGTKSVKCAKGCNRTLKRQRKFWQTLNPFNVNASGQPKSADEIYTELRAEIKTWKEEPETCKHCQ